jgi:hypothetical protein
MTARRARSNEEDAFGHALMDCFEGASVAEFIERKDGFFALLGNPKRASRMLRRLHRLTSPNARIIAEALDPYRTDEPAHLALHEENRRKGRWPGEVAIRVRYKAFRTPWYDFLLVSPDEMTRILTDTGWSLTQRIESGGVTYVAVLEKQ